MDLSLNPDSQNDEKEEKTEYKAEKDPKIQRYRKFLRLAGITGWMTKNSELDAMKSKAARYNYMKQLFIDAGFKKSLSIENCKKFKEKRDREKEIAELDLSNIIETGSSRSGRSSRSSARHDANQKRLMNPVVKLKRMAEFKESDDSDEVDENDANEVDPLANLKDLIDSDDSSSEEKKKQKKNKRCEINSSSEEE